MSTFRVVLAVVSERVGAEDIAQAIESAFPGMADIGFTVEVVECEQTS